MIELAEQSHTWISKETKIEGTIICSGVNRIFGEITGKVIGVEGSHLIFMESSRVNGEIEGETVTINGFIDGKVSASKKLSIAPFGKVKGEIFAHNFQMDFGATVEGELKITKEN